MGQRRSGNMLLWGILLFAGAAACNLILPFDTRTELQPADGAPSADGALSTDSTVPDAIDGPADTGNDALTLCDKEGEPCPGGVCHANQCCTGCWDGTTCLKGETPAACGVGGQVCEACAAKGPCITAVCQTGTCGAAPLPEGDACTDAGNLGTCHGGACCTSCWDGAACIAPPTVSKCGADGGACVDCNTPVVVSECQDQDCQAGACVTFDRPDGSPCKDGACYNGSCCTTCWTGSSCAPAVSVQHCGSNGELCTTCTAINPCDVAVCLAGACLVQTKAADASCVSSDGDVGTCQGSICCTGCWDPVVGKCEPGTTTSKCGTGGATCAGCFAPMGECYKADCSTGTCVTVLPPGTPCASWTGKCYDGTCCTGCMSLNSDSCVTNLSNTDCGVGGNICEDCSALVTASVCDINTAKCIPK